MKYGLVKKLWISATFIGFIMSFVFITQAYSPMNNVKHISQIPSSNPNFKSPNVVIQNTKHVSIISSYSSHHHSLRKRDINIAQGFRTIGKATAIAGWAILYIALAAIQIVTSISNWIFLGAAIFLCIPATVYSILAIGFNSLLYKGLGPLRELSPLAAGAIQATVGTIPLMASLALIIAIVPLFAFLALVAAVFDFHLSNLEKIRTSIENKIRRLIGYKPQPMPQHDVNRLFEGIAKVLEICNEFAMALEQADDTSQAEDQNSDNQAFETIQPNRFGQNDRTLRDVSARNEPPTTRDTSISHDRRIGQDRGLANSPASIEHI